MHSSHLVLLLGALAWVGGIALAMLLLFGGRRKKAPGAEAGAQAEGRHRLAAEEVLGGMARFGQDAPLGAPAGGRMPRR